MTGVTKFVPTAFAADEVLVLVHGRGGSQAFMNSIEGDVLLAGRGVRPAPVDMVMGRSESAERGISVGCRQQS